MIPFFWALRSFGFKVNAKGWVASQLRFFSVSGIRSKTLYVILQLEEHLKRKHSSNHMITCGVSFRISDTFKIYESSGYADQQGRQYCLHFQHYGQSGPTSLFLIKHFMQKRKTKLKDKK